MSKATVPTAGEFVPSAALLKRARRYMADYSLVIRSRPNGGYTGSSPEFPGTLVGGETPERCAHNLDFMIETIVASYLADGQTPPSPAGREKRTEQVNVRFTRSERTMLEQESARQGFRGIADLIRAEVIRQASGSHA